MAEEPETTVDQTDKQPIVVSSVEDMDAAKARIIGLNHAIGKIDARRDRTIGRARDRFNQIKQKAEEQAHAESVDMMTEREELREAIAVYAMKNRRNLRHRFGKVVANMLGTVGWTTRDAVDTPADTTEAVNFLLNRRGGKKFLRVRYELDKKALHSAPADLKRQLRRRFHVDIGKFEILYMKLPGENKPTQLRRYRFPLHRHQ